MVDEFTLSLMLVEQGSNPTSAPFFGLQYFSKIIFTLAIECNKIVLHLLNPIFCLFSHGLQYFSKTIFTLAVECNKIVLHLLNPIFSLFSHGLMRPI